MNWNSSSFTFIFSYGMSVIVHLSWLGQNNFIFDKLYNTHFLQLKETFIVEFTGALAPLKKLICLGGHFLHPGSVMATHFLVDF